MYKNLLLIFLVLEADLIETLSPRRRITLHATWGVDYRQLAVRHVIAGVQDAHYDRLARISVRAVDHDLQPNPRNEHGAPLLPGPNLADAQPRRALFVMFALASPVELRLR